MIDGSQYRNLVQGGGNSARPGASHYDAFASTVATLTSSNMLLICRRKPQKFEVLAAYGSSVRELPLTWRFPPRNHVIQPFRLYQNIHTDPAFRDHPLRQLHPRVQSALVMDLAPPPEDVQMLAINPSYKALSQANVLSGIAQLWNWIPMLVSHASQKGFAEPAVTFSQQEPEPGPVSEFLLRTLLKAHKVHSVEAHNYFTVRKWRKSVREVQIDALKSLKTDPPKAFVTSAAEEIARLAESLVSGARFTHVVPVPCGSSGKEECLSVMLAKACAIHFGADFSPVLEHLDVPRRGASHPRRSSSLRGYSLSTNVEGPILLVDDVATTGQHLSKAIEALKKTGQPITAISWIGRE